MAKTTGGSSRKTHKSKKTAEDRGTGSVSVALTKRPSSRGELTAPLIPSDTERPTVDRPNETGDSTQLAQVVPQEDPRLQWWFRPPDSKARQQANKVVVLRAAGHKDAVIAKKLGMAVSSVQNVMYLARKNGWLGDDDEPIDLEAELALSIDRKIVRNIGSTLDGRMTNWQTHEMTIAAAKGRGVFKNHEVAKNENGGGSLPVVAIQVIMPTIGAQDQLPAVDESQMGGTPAYLEGAVEDGVLDS